MNCKFYVRARANAWGNASDETHRQYNNEQQLIPIRAIDASAMLVDHKER